MSMAAKLRQYLDEHDVEYDVTEHRKTSTSASTADVSHVPVDCLAKGVVVKGEQGYLVVVVPASKTVKLDAVQGWLKQPVALAREDEINALFPDCEIGAIPPVPAAYGLRAAVDENLDRQPDIYFEGGDHRTLVHLSGDQFRQLMAKVPHDRFSA